ncbi:MAG: hypothetical protein ABSE51_01260 [Terracidiphilus sp.]|jgi:hypothetical protein
MMKVKQHLGQKLVPCRANVALITEAEKELSAFLLAVTEVHGPQCAAVAAMHWMQAFENICLPSLASKECFRRVIVAAVISVCHYVVRATIRAEEINCRQFSLQ